MKRSQAPSNPADRLSALAEPTRLRILRLLEREELSVGEVARVVQLPQSTVSRHLKVLARGDGGAWLARRAEGTATLYRLVMDDLPAECRDLWVAVRPQLGALAEAGEDDLRLEAVLRERSDSQAFFGRVAGQWDDVRDELFGERFMSAALLPLVPSDWVVADLGCGTGNASELLAPHVERVLAVDQSAPMLKAAKKRLAEHDNVEFLRGELDDLPIDDRAADAVVLALVLHHVDALAESLAEVVRILKPGGIVLVIDMVEHERDTYHRTMGHVWLGFDEDRITSLLEEAGLTQPRYVELPRDPVARGPGLFTCTAIKPKRSKR